MFYDKFMELCNSKGVKPSKVAIDAGFNKGSVSVWKKKHENGEDVTPSIKILKLIADYFNVTPDYLLGKEEIDINSIRFAAYQELETADEDLVEDVLSYIRFKKSQKKDEDQ